MLFNSFEFIFVFVPAVWTVFYLLDRRGLYRHAIAWLAVASLFFYGWWNPPYVALLVSSVLFNYGMGVLLGLIWSGKLRQLLLGAGIGVNLCLLGYFKYMDFFVANLNAITDANFEIGTIILPLGISFFTFQQIAFLVDVYRNDAREQNFLAYLLFVTFFPQLIAGPIVHHKEMMPQFAPQSASRIKSEDLAVGLTIFFIGLFKKTVLADSIEQYATPVFDAASAGTALTFFEAWGAAVAYTLQLYFDFSGYSDMAIGLARMFGIRLPLNFYFPYKATSIIDFWRRWHMTLSRFLRDYLYIPLGGGRKGIARQLLSLVVTMLLGGLWHGAGWTFVLWGALHGVYLMLNYGWRKVATAVWPGAPGNSSAIGRTVARLLSFGAVVVAWVLFRADSLDAALRMLHAMSGSGGVTIPVSVSGSTDVLAGLLTTFGIEFRGQSVIPLRDWAYEGIPIISLLLLVVWWAPNTYQLMIGYSPALVERPFNTIIGSQTRPVTWYPGWYAAIALAILVTSSVLALSRVREFLYYQF